MRESPAERQNGFAISFMRTEDKNVSTGHHLAGILLFAGLFWCLWNVLGLTGTGVNPLMLLSAGCAYSIVGCGLLPKWRVLSIVAVIVPAALVIFGSRYVSAGWNASANQVFLTLESYLGRIFPRYEISEAIQQPLSAALFLLLPTAVLAFLCGRATGTGKRWYCVAHILAFILWAAALFFSGPASIGRYRGDNRSNSIPGWAAAFPEKPHTRWQRVFSEKLGADRYLYSCSGSPVVTCG